MLVLTRENSTGQTKYSFSAGSTQTQGESFCHPCKTDLVKQTKTPSDLSDLSDLSGIQRQIMQSFDYLLSNIEQKSNIAGFVVNTDGMRDSFASRIFR